MKERHHQFSANTYIIAAVAATFTGLAVTFGVGFYAGRATARPGPGMAALDAMFSPQAAERRRAERARFREEMEREDRELTEVAE